MKKACFLLSLVFLSFCVLAQKSNNITQLDHWFQDSLITNSTNVRYNDCYGFVWKNQEYAVAGSTEGTHVFLIDTSNQFIPVGFIKGRYSNAQVSHRDYAVFKHYLYAVCDEGTSSLQIIDFQDLPNSISLIKEDSVQFGRVHNIFIDTVQETFYSCIHRSVTNTQTIESAMKLFSLADPINLTELWSGPADIQEVHDCYVRNGKAILNCGYEGMRVYDFSNPQTPVFLDSKTIYQDQGYNHQGWLTPSGNTYYFADETNGKRIKKCAFDGSEISIKQLFGVNHQNGSVPHNIMATDSFVYVAYYNEGLRIFDARYPIPTEIAYFDSYSEESFFKQNGNWGLYTLLPSQRMLISDRQNGLFLLGFDAALFSEKLIGDAGFIYPNPAKKGETIVLRLPLGANNSTLSLYNVLGELLMTYSFDATDYTAFVPNCAAGSYVVTIDYTDKKQQAQHFTSKLIIE
jgi:choice-of-anchor B domain-containing protein